MTPGIHHIPAAEYHRDPCPAPSLSNSLIKTLLTQTPAHAWLKHPRLNPDYVAVEAEKYDIGTAAHAMLLEGVDNVRVIECADWRTKAAKEERENARAAGQTPLLRHQYEEALEMVSAAQDFMAARGFSGGEAERTIVWQDDGIWCRAMMDKTIALDTAQATILDYKTTSCPNPQTFMRTSMVSFGYDTQDTFYRRGVRAVTGRDPAFVFMVQEDTAPFACYLVQCAESMREMAHDKVDRALAMWRQCMASDAWPGYSQDIYYAQAPMWAMQEAQEQA